MHSLKWIHSDQQAPAVGVRSWHQSDLTRRPDTHHYNSRHFWYLFRRACTVDDDSIGNFGQVKRQLRHASSSITRRHKHVVAGIAEQWTLTRIVWWWSHWTVDMADCVAHLSQSAPVMTKFCCLLAVVSLLANGQQLHSAEQQHIRWADRSGYCVVFVAVKLISRKRINNSFWWFSSAVITAVYFVLVIVCKMRCNWDKIAKKSTECIRLNIQSTTTSRPVHCTMWTLGWSPERFVKQWGIYMAVWESNENFFIQWR